MKNQGVLQDFTLIFTFAIVSTTPQLYFVLDAEAKAQASAVPSPKKGAKKSKTKSSKERKTSTAAPEDEKESIKSVVFKGKSPVDDNCPIRDKVNFLVVNS